MRFASARSHSDWQINSPTPHPLGHVDGVGFVGTLRNVLQKRQALVALRQKGSPLVGYKDEKILVLLVRVVSIKLPAHGASLFWNMHHFGMAFWQIDLYTYIYVYVYIHMYV